MLRRPRRILSAGLLAGVAWSVAATGVATAAATTSATTAAETAATTAATTPPAPAPATLAPARYLEEKLTADSLWQHGDVAGAAAIYGGLVSEYPADGDMAWRLAQALYRQGKVDEAMPLGERALAAGFAEESRTAYAFAQVHARAGRRGQALAWLERSLAARYDDRPGILGDEAFAALRDDPAFRRLAGVAPEGLADRVAGWRHDLDFFVAEARRMHASPQRTVWSDAFVADVGRLKARIPELDDAAAMVELQKIVVAHLGDGHSVVYPMPTERMRFGMLPVSFYFFADGLFVVQAGPGYQHLVGSRVTALGGKPVDGILGDLAAVVSHDNAQGIRWLGPLYLRFPAMLRALGYAADASQATLTYVDGRRTRSVTLPAGPPAHTGDRIPPPPGDDAPAAWLARSGEVAWHEPRPALDAHYLQLNNVQHPSRERTLPAVAGEVRAALAAGGARNLVIDLRHNNGGNNFLVWPLVRLVAWHEMQGEGRRTFVLTGRNTFSACQNLVSQLHRATAAVFVGEPSSSKPNHNGESTAILLPWSGLRLSIASRWWQDSWPEDRRPYIPVSMPVPYTSADWLANRDPVLDALASALDPGDAAR